MIQNKPLPSYSLKSGLMQQSRARKMYHYSLGFERKQYALPCFVTAETSANPQSKET